MHYLVQPEILGRTLHFKANSWMNSMKKKLIEILSWNVNGIRSALKKGLREFIDQRQPDIFCLQEIRTPGDSAGIQFDGYHASWNHAVKKGYSGTAIFSKTRPLSVSCGMKPFIHDDEGRIVTAEFNKLYLVNVYVPNSKRDLSRLSYRHKEWDPAFIQFITQLDHLKPVIFCGDMNVAHQEIDLSNPKANVKNHGFTPEEREGFDQILKAGFHDSYRMFHSGAEHYTWWSRLANCRARNIGWRIDYFGISKNISNKVIDAFILKEVYGSDHCPVGITMESNVL